MITGSYKPEPTCKNSLHHSISPQSCTMEGIKLYGFTCNSSFSVYNNLIKIAIKVITSMGPVQIYEKLR